VRSETSPSNGERSTQSLTSKVARSSRALVDMSSASLLALSACFFSISLSEAKPPDFSSAMRAASCDSATCCV
jgi:hypothetical protein